MLRFLAFLAASFVIAAALSAQVTWREWNQKGENEFRAAEIAASIKSFDKAIQLEPRLAPHHWQRGISLYYASRWKDCVKQFALHKTVNPEDVENAVWHALCVEKTKGREAASKDLIAVSGDGRVPMAQVHRLFAGRATPEDVSKAAGTDPNARFYANLYLALYWEFMGDAAKAKPHMLDAGAEPSANHYMGDVARVHCAVRGWKR
ncbi:MAG: hypothetical protein R2729_01335 [Bryobacteraceae bacterium]